MNKVAEAEVLARSRPLNLIHAGEVIEEPKWRNDAACTQGGWNYDIHGTVMADVSLDWNSSKPYVYLDLFWPDDKNDPQAGFIYIGKGEHHAESGTSIIDHRYTGSPGKTNEFRSIVNRAKQHEIIKRIVSVHDTVEECREAERALILKMWEAHGRVDEGGIVTNLTIDAFEAEPSPQNSEAKSKAQRGKPRGKGRPILIREPDGKERVFNSRTEAVRWLSKGKYRALITYNSVDKFVNDQTARNRDTLKVHDPSGLLVCFQEDRNNPMRETTDDRRITGHHVDGYSKTQSKCDWARELGVTGKQVMKAAADSRRSRLQSVWLLEWADGLKRGWEKRPPIFDRITSDLFDNRKLEALGLKPVSCYQCADRNAESQFVTHCSKGIRFVYAADLQKPMRYVNVERAVVVTDIDMSRHRTFFTQKDAMEATRDERDFDFKAAVFESGANQNEELIDAGMPPTKWATTAGSYIVTRPADFDSFIALESQRSKPKATKRRQYIPADLIQPAAL